MAVSLSSYQWISAILDGMALFYALSASFRVSMLIGPCSCEITNNEAPENGSASSAGKVMIAVYIHTYSLYLYLLPRSFLYG